jgi:hypothetical protein
LKDEELMTEMTNPYRDNATMIRDLEEARREVASLKAIGDTDAVRELRSQNSELAGTVARQKVQLDKLSQKKAKQAKRVRGKESDDDGFPPFFRSVMLCLLLLAMFPFACTDCDMAARHDATVKCAPGNVVEYSWRDESAVCEMDGIKWIADR